MLDPQMPHSDASRRSVRSSRAKAPAPKSDVAFDHLSLDDLRAMRLTLTDQETRASYWRRILQARIDLLKAGDDQGVVRNLSRVLTDEPSAHRRLAHVTVDAVDDVLPLPDLAQLWSRVPNPTDPASVAALVADLRVAEQQISVLRSELFLNIDAVTAELIARFHDNPSLALVALPRR